MASNDGDEISEHWDRFSDVAKEPLRMLPPIAGFRDKPLVSLEEAIKPLIKHVSDIETYASKAKKKSQAPSPHDLTVDEMASIRLYTMEWKVKEESLYTVMNSNLRSEDRNLLKDWFLYLNLFITGLEKIPSSRGQFFRGVNENLSAKYPNGQIFVWWAFSSCTQKEEVAVNFSGKTDSKTIFMIQCESGKDISKYSSYSKESEILLIAATEFQVVANVNKGNGLAVVYLKEREPKYPHIENLGTPNLPQPPRSPSQSGNSSGKYSTTTKEPKITKLQFEPDQSRRTSEVGRLLGQISPRSPAIINGRQISEQDMEAIVKDVITEKRCPKLEMHDNKMSPESITTLGRGIAEDTTLNEVDLSKNRWSSKDVYRLTKELSVHKTKSVVLFKICGLQRTKEVECGQIKILKLGHNNINDEGIAYLVSLIKSKKSITDLYLNDNQIGDEGIEQLANALSHPDAKLQKLYLHSNKGIKNRGADYLIEMLKKNQSLNTLWLENCSFNGDKRRKLIEAIQSNKRFYLNIERY